MAEVTIKEESNKKCATCGGDCINCPGCGELTNFCQRDSLTDATCDKCGTKMTPSSDTVQPACRADVVPANPPVVPSLSDQIADLHNSVLGLSFVSDCIINGLRDYQLNPPRPGSDGMNRVLEFTSGLNNHIQSLTEAIDSFQIQMDSFNDSNLPSEAVAALDTVVLASKKPSDYLVVEDRTKPSTWHLPVKKNGKPDHHLMGAAWAALHGGYRGNKYDGPKKQEAISKLKALYKREKLPLPSEKGGIEKGGIADEFMASTEPDAMQKLRKVMKDEKVPFLPEAVAKKEKPVDTKKFNPPQSEFISEATRQLLDKYLLRSKAGLKAEDADSKLTEYLLKQPLTQVKSDPISAPAGSTNVEAAPGSQPSDSDKISKPGTSKNTEPAPALKEGSDLNEYLLKETLTQVKSDSIANPGTNDVVAPQKSDIPNPAIVNDVAPKASDTPADFLQDYILDKASTKDSKDINLDDYLLMEHSKDGLHTNLMYKVKHEGACDHELMKACYASLHHENNPHSFAKRHEATKKLEKLFKEHGLPLPKAA
jgi:hypothetical protein